MAVKVLRPRVCTGLRLGTRFDGIPGFDQKEGWQFGESDEDKGRVAVHLYADGRFHVTSPAADLMYLTGKVRT